ncbi:hypothetical protein Bca52824_033643 [Brassica carinata]|uniref:Uncharacterized protein n=1 Tax=Brassica carinata TaxID=52824 RepID=A0A8X7SFC8_BRACI|nr:hypothetical protein Bca52824_033643 [Brassica carinata]
MDLEPPSRGPLSFVSTSLQEVAIQYDAPPEQDYISPHQTSSPALGLLPRIPATQRLGSGSGPITINFEGTSSSPLPDHVMPSKAAGKRKPSKLVGKKKLVRSSPLQSLNLTRINVGRSLNPPRKKLCIEKATSLPCNKAGPRIT